QIGLRADEDEAAVAGGERAALDRADPRSIGGERGQAGVAPDRVRPGHSIGSGHAFASSLPPRMTLMYRHINATASGAGAHADERSAMPVIHAAAALTP